MSQEKIDFSIWSNNEQIENYLCKKKDLGEISFKKILSKNIKDYICVFLDLNSQETDITAKLYEIYLLAKNKNAKIAYVILPELNNTSEKLNKYLKIFCDLENKNIVHRTIVCQDLYFLDPNHTITDLDSYINKKTESEEINISQKGNQKIYPISIISLLELIKKSLFLSNTNGKIFYAQGIETSDLKIAYLIKKYINEFCSQDIDLNNSSYEIKDKINLSQNTYQTSALLNWNNEDQFEKDLIDYIKDKKEFFENNENNLASNSQKNQKNYPFKELIHKIFRTKIKREDNYKKRTLKIIEKYLERGILAIILIYFSSSLFFVASSFYALKSLEKTIFYFKKGNFEESIKNANKFSTLQLIAEENYNFVSPVVKILFQDLHSTNQNFINFLNYSNTAVTGLHQTYTLAESVYKSINSPENKIDYTNIALALKSNLQFVYESISQLEIILSKGILPQPLIQIVQQNIEYKQLKQSQEQLGELIKVIDFMPDLLGDKKNSNIYVLVQNTSEQRATGGLIEYVYQINFDKGRVIYQKMFNPQEIDKVDSFSLIPPPFVEKITGESVWRLKDMNYNPDFPQTATNIAWYLEKKLKIKADVIIALNSSALNTSETNNKKEIFENTIDSFLNRKITTQQALESISSTVINNNLQLWASDDNLEKNILSQKISGSIRDYNCHPAMSSSRQCLSQTSHINFSNFSSIPLNDYLKKSTTHTITPTVLSIDHQFDIKYSYQKNTPLTNRNLTEVVQFYTPQKSIITEISLNGSLVETSNMIVQEENLLIRHQFMLSTTLNSDQHLIIKYSVPLQERTLLPISYSITDIKQFGQKNEDSSLVIMIPERSRASAITSEVTSFPDKIVYRQGSSISTFGVNFVPKLP